MHIVNAKSDKEHDYLFRTPVGQALYPHLLTPDTRFDDRGTYKVGIFLEPAEIAAARDALTALYRRAFPDAQGEPHLPIKAEGERNYILAKSTYKPKLLDAERKVIPDPLLVSTGHRVRLSGRARPFKSSFVTGVALYLAGVEIHEPLAGLDVFRGAPARSAGPAEVETTRAPVIDDDEMPF